MAKHIGVTMELLEQSTPIFAEKIGTSHSKFSISLCQSPVLHRNHRFGVTHLRLCFADKHVLNVIFGSNLLPKIPQP
jgi:hypothetical protein